MAFLPFIAFALAFLSVHSAVALNNGAARTPPMGWSTWNKLKCKFNASVLLDVGRALKSSGMVRAGYRSLNIDDCWPLKQRASDGSIVPDPSRFPDGMRAFRDQLKAETGLELGIYTAHGASTCQGCVLLPPARASLPPAHVHCSCVLSVGRSLPRSFPGSLGHEVADAASYKAWGVVYVKNDWCWHKEENQTLHLDAFIAMRDALNATGVPMAYSIHWNFDDTPGPGCALHADCPEVLSSVANLWRVGGDIGSNWNAVLRLIDIDTDRASAGEANISRYAAPGSWNDADMLEVGNGMTAAQDRAHFAMWAMLASPLIAGNDPRSMTADTIATLTNADAIAISQDALGKQAVLLPRRASGGAGASARGAGPATQVWAKALANGDVALVMLNRQVAKGKGGATRIVAELAKLAGALGPAYANKTAASAHDIWRNETFDVVNAVGVTVNASSCAFLRLAF